VRLPLLSSHREPDQFPGFISFIGFAQCREMRGAFELGHGSRNPSGGGGLT